MSITGIVLAAGTSSRYGNNKILEKVNDKYILEYSLDVFNNHNKIDNMVITTKEEYLDIIKDIVSKYDKDIKVVIGGETRKESVYKALNSTSSDIVLIHDAARPLVKAIYIDNCLNEINNYDGVIVGVKAVDTIKIVDTNNLVVSTTNRDRTYLVQTPQCFKRLELLELHKKYNNINVTDDASLLELDNKSIKIVDGDYQNIKLTYKEDLEIIKKYLKK